MASPYLPSAGPNGRMISRNLSVACLRLGYLKTMSFAEPQFCSRLEYLNSRHVSVESTAKPQDHLSVPAGSLFKLDPALRRDTAGTPIVAFLRKLLIYMALPRGLEPLFSP